MVSSRYIVNILEIPGRGFRWQVLDDSRMIVGKRKGMGSMVIGSGTLSTREAAYDSAINLLRNRASEGR